MKTKILLLGALIGAATLSANAGVHFGFSIGLPRPVALTAPAVVVAAPAVVVAPPVCPADGYVWMPGYWSVSGYNRCWVAGRWQYRPGYGGYGHAQGWRR
jgi:hypothetical protein